MDSLMTIKEAAQYLKLNYMTVYKLAQKGKVPASKVGGTWRFKKEVLDDWLIHKMPTGSGSVLVIDDDPKVRDILKEMVVKHGCTVVTAKNGEVALKEVGKQHFDLFFLDLVLPGISGVDVLQAIKDKGGNPVVAIVTGYGDYRIALQAMSMGPLMLIRKPFRESDIAEVLKIVMKGETASAVKA